MYKDYLQELTGLQFLENDNGFIGYKMEDDACFIGEVYAKPDYRGNNLFYDLNLSVEKKASSLNIKEMYGHIQVASPTKDAIMMAVLKSGYKIRDWNINTLEVYKEVPNV